MKIRKLYIKDIIRYLKPDEIIFATVPENYSEAFVEFIYYDTRLIYETNNALFVALKGKKDGHSFVKEALKKGVKIFLVSNINESFPEDCIVIQVKNTLKALQIIAKEYRKKIQGKIIAITGSSGKTIVKEWLYTLLKQQFNICKSPKSFNSQLGVPLSILSCPVGVDYAIIEAGISRKNEMNVLREIIKPDIGIFTTITTAHNENFHTEEEKIREKMLLFSSVKTLYTTKSAYGCIKNFLPPGVEVKLFEIKKRQEDNHLEICGKNFPCPFEDNISVYNLALSIFCACELGVGYDAILKGLQEITPVEMRMEILQNNDVMLINDAYNSDLNGFIESISFLTQNHWSEKKIIIFTPLEEQKYPEHLSLFKIIKEKIGKENAYYIGEKYSSLAEKYVKNTYPSVSDFILGTDFEEFKNSVILLKGARKYRLEKLLPYLLGADRTSVLEINLDNLLYNYRLLRKFTGEKTQFLVMLKAEAYGSGAWNVAKVLEEEPSLYGFSVATLGEALQLRKHKIKNRILVLIPSEFISAYFDFNLMPAVGDFMFLEKLGKESSLRKEQLSIHLEFDTGMSRLGFLPEELPEVIKALKKFPFLKIVGTFTHLASSEDFSEDDFTKGQLREFEKITKTLSQYFPGIKFHALNSAGVIRFGKDFPYPIARIGIALYGVEPVPNKNIGLKQIATLKTKVLQVHNYKKGRTIGYNRSYKLQKNAQIATLGIGYADGVPRNIQDYEVFIGETPAKIVGKICMDMCMVLPEKNISAGDTAVIFGENAKHLTEFAKAQMTIPYEAIVRISHRVYRKYIKEK